MVPVRHEWPDIDIVIPVRRSGTIDRLLRSLSCNTVLPTTVLLVTNDLDAQTIDPYGLTVKLVRFASDTYPIGFNDAALRRNVGIWTATASRIMTFDDDQVASPTLVQSTARVLEGARVCWGHHRFIDIEQWSFDELLALSPEAGRTREMPPNAWHSWRSAYAGLFAAETTLVKEAGGFDMTFSGRHGGEDQDLGRRLALLVGDGEGVYVYEPPFAWHPERNTPWDPGRDANVCADGHLTLMCTIDGVAAHACARCPHYWVVDPPCIGEVARLPFDVTRVRVEIEAVPAAGPQDAAASTAPRTAPYVSEQTLGHAMAALRVPYDAFVTTLSPPDRAISLEAAAVLSVLCDRLAPRRVLDLGAGFNSFVLRRALADRGVEVWTADDDPQALESVRGFVESSGLAADGFVPWDEIPPIGSAPFDLVFHDLGPMATRARLLPEVVNRVAAPGVLVLDDMHKGEYAADVERVLLGGAWRYIDGRPWSLDGFGRFVGVILRGAVTSVAKRGSPEVA